jgi:3-deoxy-manno-octulosonate cytidylyltransferase (CMP-KDO synthetase)
MGGDIIAIIPARMGSSRFPGKPMALLQGIPMIGHVYLRTRMCPLLTETYVATCDREIFDYIAGIGGQAVMTADTHERASDRTAEALLKIEAATGRRGDIAVMVQGDEPMVTPGMLEQALVPLLADSSLKIVNLMAPIRTTREFEDVNEVKVVVDLNGRALYFSREPIPSRKKGVAEVPMLRQLGLILFRRDFLLKFNSLPPTPLEQIESVDMLRLLEHGERVQMVLTEMETLGVDTPEDLQVANAMMEDDPLMQHYAQLAAKV